MTIDLKLYSRHEYVRNDPVIEHNVDDEYDRDDPSVTRWRAQWESNMDGMPYAIGLYAYPVLRVTPMGAWIAEINSWRPGDGWLMANRIPDAPKRWVSNTGRQAWAKPTRDEALLSLIARLNIWSDRARHERRRILAAAATLEAVLPTFAPTIERIRQEQSS